LQLGRPKAASENPGSATTPTDPELAGIKSYLPLAKIAALLGLHVATVYRWTNRGCRGFRLGFVQRSATRCTTREWLDDFFEQLTRASQGPVPPPRAPTAVGSAPAAPRSRKPAEEAGQELNRVWDKPPSTPLDSR
jgi:hypothetical protein